MNEDSINYGFGNQMYRSDSPKSIRSIKDSNVKDKFLNQKQNVNMNFYDQKENTKIKNN